MTKAKLGWIALLMADNQVINFITSIRNVIYICHFYYLIFNLHPSPGMKKQLLKAFRYRKLYICINLIQT